MAREIKFRGLTINGKWHYGNLAILTQKVGIAEPGSYISNSVGVPFAYQVRPETVGQYTGLKDKNGKEIYEGDIANITLGLVEQGGYTERGVMQWNEKSASFSFLCNDSLFDAAFNRPDAFKVEVIGNIYENPELLKEPIDGD